MMPGGADIISAVFGDLLRDQVKAYRRLVVWDRSPGGYSAHISAYKGHYFDLALYRTVSAGREAPMMPGGAEVISAVFGDLLRDQVKANRRLVVWDRSPGGHWAHISAYKGHCFPDPRWGIANCIRRIMHCFDLARYLAVSAGREAPAPDYQSPVSLHLGPL